MKKKIVVGVIILIAIVAFIIFNNGDTEYNFETVEERELVEEVFESGIVKSGDSLNLSFRTGGTLQELNVSEGQSVSQGDFIAGLDTSDLEIKKSQAQSRIESQSIELDLLRQGARQEEIEDLERRLEEAEDALEIAERSLNQAKSSKETALDNAYTGIPSLLGKVEIFSKEVKDEYKELRSRYFSGFYLQDTYRARSLIREVENAYDDLRSLSRSIDKGSSFEEMDAGLSQAEETLDLIEKNTETLIDISETDFYERRFSTESSSLLWEIKDNVSEMLSQVVGRKGEIRKVRDETDSSITSAESNLSSARSARNEVGDRLESAKRGGRDEEVEAAQASLRSSVYDLELIQRDIDRSSIFSPQSGKVSRIHHRKSEEVSPGSPVVTLLTDDDFYVQVDIYEGDISSVNIDDPVEVEFVAFPGEEFSGRVAAINETGKVVDGVVYYEVDIVIDDAPERLMAEMTADTTIETSRKTVISLPREAIRRDGARRYVKVLEDDQVKEVDVETGITDAYGYTEIISGVSDGDKVIID